MLGAGQGLVLPDWLLTYALPLLIGGVFVHGIGMTLNYRRQPGRFTPVVGAGIVLAVLGSGLAALGLWIAVFPATR